MKLIIYCDGGSRGNPGPGGIGVVIRQRDKETKRQKEKKISKFIGEATNNQAEYKAVIEALKWVEENKSQLGSDLDIECFLDSKLVVEQLNQNFKIKNEGLKPLFWQVREKIMNLGGKVTFQYIPREKNVEADKLVNEALDRKKNV